MEYLEKRKERLLIDEMEKEAARAEHTQRVMVKEHTDKELWWNFLHGVMNKEDIEACRCKACKELLKVRWGIE